MLPSLLKQNSAKKTLDVQTSEDDVLITNIVEE